MTLEIRPLGNDEAAWGRLVDIDSLAFGTTPDVDCDDRPVMELDRGVLAWDGTTAVGCASAFSLNLSTPGGQVPTCGVTWLGVLPTHRRRGLMTRLLDHVHADGLRRGEPVAALWASQGAIYPRFGYGVASRSLSLSLPRASGLSRLPDLTGVATRLLPAAEDRPWTDPVYAAAREARPGAPQLDDRWYARQTYDPAEHREGGSPLRTLVALQGERPLAYVRFRTSHNWEDSYGRGTIDLRELVSAEPRGAAALWQVLVEMELMEHLRWWNAPVDDPLLQWLTEIRHIQARIRDALYVRILDLPRALEARTYRLPVDLVLAVEDSQQPQNARRWRLSGDATGATCAETRENPDVAVDTAVVAATYLGSTRWQELAAAGAVREHRPGAVDRLDLAFSHHPHAWSPFVF